LTPEQQALVQKARDSLKAARLLHANGQHGFAASRAYYTMFYLAEALLLREGLAFSKHGAVHAQPLASDSPRLGFYRPSSIAISYVPWKSDTSETTPHRR